MSLQNNVPVNSYSLVAKILHWLIALIIIVQFSIGINFDNFDKPLKIAMINRHAVVGVILIFLVLFRLLWRLTHRVPALPASVPTWQIWASTASHYLFYVLMLAVPVVGLVTRFARGSGINFGFFLLPSPWLLNKPLAESSENLHGLLAYTLVGLAVVHISAALYHYLFLKDGVMNRMWRTKSAA